MKILLSAYACEPNRGSEPGIGWNMAQAIARQHQVWVLTSNTHRAAIEAEMARQPIANLHFAYLDPLGWVYDWSQEGQKTLWDAYFHYYFWQIAAYGVGRSLHQTIGFDLTHHVTYLKYQNPSFLSLLPIPFIWGPIGGAESAPRAFWRDFTPKQKLFETLRTCAQISGQWDPLVRLTLRRSALIWAATADTAQCLVGMGAAQVEVVNPLGMHQAELQELCQYPPAPVAPIRFISIGRLLHWKAFHLGLKAFAQAQLPDAEFWIVGIGPDRERLEALAAELNIVHQVKFWGKLSRPDTLQRLAESHVLVHPSLHDSGGWVCLEAMAIGRPVLCLDLGGPAVQVGPDSGIKVPAHHPDQAVHDLAQAITQLATDAELRDRLGKGGQQRIYNQFTWESRTQSLTHIYQVLCANG
jgi:glycosyltransferase involved in cell wall biosynthesis